MLTGRCNKPNVFLSVVMGQEMDSEADEAEEEGPDSAKRQGSQGGLPAAKRARNDDSPAEGPRRRVLNARVRFLETI